MNFKQLASVLLELSLVSAFTSCREMAEAFKEGYYGTAYKKNTSTVNSSQLSATSNNQLAVPATSSDPVEQQMIAEAYGYLQTGSIPKWTTPAQGVHQYCVFRVAIYLACCHGVLTGGNGDTLAIMQNLKRTVTIWYGQFLIPGMTPQYLAEEQRSCNSREAKVADQALENLKALAIQYQFSEFWTSTAFDWYGQDILNHLNDFRLWIQGQDSYTDAFMKRMDEVNKQYERSLMKSIPNYQ